MITNRQIILFMEESDRIERETHNNQLDVAPVKEFLKGDITEKSLLKLHKELAKNKWGNPEWGGKYRIVNVIVANYHPPEWHKVKEQMDDYLNPDNIGAMDAWTAHNEFESIHPFQDGNGRIGRLIWLHKHISRYPDGLKYSFLQSYYYQTLAHYND